MILFFLSFLYSTNIYSDKNETKVTSIRFKKTKKDLYQENLTNLDTPIHLVGMKKELVKIKKIAAFKYILIDSITIKVDEIAIEDANQFPFRVVNGGRILIQNSLNISSKSTDKVFIPKIINLANTINLANAHYIVNSTTSNSNSYNLQNATLSFEGDAFFANSISGDSDSIIDLQNAYSLTVEDITGNLTIICGNSVKTNLYVSKSSFFSQLIVYNNTDFFALNCTIGKVTVFSNNSRIINYIF